MSVLRYQAFFLTVFYFSATVLCAQQFCLTRLTADDRAIDQRAFDEDSILYIYTVIHVLYQDSSQYIEDTDILAQLESVSRDLRRLNEDRDDTPSMFVSVAADCKIELCLARLDPDGQPTSGITKRQTNVREIGLTDRYYQTGLGGIDLWDPGRYLNIWVCQISEIGDIGGFAELPQNELTSAEGVVIDYRFFGEGNKALSPFDKGRTLTHEIGHWLGLEHIWGAKAGCDIDDGITDTPRQFDRYRGCPAFPQSSCGTEDMFMNFMDLTDDRCMNLFTAGQKDLMRNTLLSVRPGLVLSSCDEPTTAIVEFKSSQLAIPNPATTYLYLGDAKYDYLDLRDLTGTSVLTQSRGDLVNISALKSGTYLMLMKVKSKVIFQKIIKIP
ncbi:MAG: T9SS type A sorting domain-containing protein [Saprospiraceae bacterium]|nr:T9SS type A sorting domain-containing protein [Saprospiraceae bacterium]